jgi:hypothetical protein
MKAQRGREPADAAAGDQHLHGPSPPFAALIAATDGQELMDGCFGALVGRCGSVR